MAPVPLHLTKVAFAITSLDQLRERIAMRAAEGQLVLTTRYLPKRHAEMTGGSLFWIVKHQLVARSPLMRFGEAEGGRIAIHLDPALMLVVPAPKRAHQGWRYLEQEHAPRDLGGGEGGAEELPARLAGELSALGLI